MWRNREIVTPEKNVIVWQDNPRGAHTKVFDGYGHVMWKEKGFYTEYEKGASYTKVDLDPRILLTAKLQLIDEVYG